MVFTIYRDASDLGTVGRDEKKNKTKKKQKNNCIINFKQKRGYSELYFSRINTLHGAPSNPESLKIILDIKSNNPVVHVYSIYF